MIKLLRSDLMHKFLGGFVLGSLAIVAFQPAASREALIDRADAVVHSFV